MIDKNVLRSSLSSKREMEIAQYFVDKYATELQNNDFKSLCEDLIKHSLDHSKELYEIYVFLLLNFNVNLTSYLQAGDILNFSNSQYADNDGQIEIDCPVIYRNSFYFDIIGKVYLTENVKKIETFGIKYRELKLYITDKLEKIETYGIIRHSGEETFILEAYGATPSDLKVSTVKDYHKVIYEAIRRGKKL